MGRDELWGIWIFFFRKEYLYYAPAVVAAILAVSLCFPPMRANYWWAGLLGGLTSVAILLPFIWFMLCFGLSIALLIGIILWGVSYAAFEAGGVIGVLIVWVLVLSFLFQPATRVVLVVFSRR